LPPEPLAEESQCRLLILALLYESIDHVLVLVDCSPHVAAFALDSIDGDFAEKPGIAQLSLTVSQPPGALAAEVQTPVADRFVGHHDIALGQQLLDVTKTHAKAMVNPDSVADDLVWQPVAAITVVLVHAEHSA
jgi:hypothetical protein